MVKITPPKLPFGKLDVGEKFGRKLKIEGVPSEAEPLWKWANNVNLAKLLFTPLGNGVWEATLTIDANQDTIGEHRRTLVIVFGDVRLEVPVTYEIVDGIEDFQPVAPRQTPTIEVAATPSPAPRPAAPAPTRTIPTPTPVQPRVAPAAPPRQSPPVARPAQTTRRNQNNNGAGLIAAAVVGILLLFVFVALFALRPVIDTAFNSLATQFADAPAPTPTTDTTNLGAGSVSMQICADAPVSRVYKGVRGRISNIGEGVTINIFNAATVYSGILANTSAGTAYHITDGPVCADGYTWWYVQLQTDPPTEGWVVEADNQFNYLSQ